MVLSRWVIGRRVTGIGLPQRQHEYGRPPYLPAVPPIGENLAMAKKRAHRPVGYEQAAATAGRVAPGAPAPGRPRPAAGASAAGTSPARARFEAFSAPILVRMQLLPAFVVPVLLGVMLFFGLVVPANWAGILLVLIAVFLGWLTAVSWPVVSPFSRVLRLVVDVAVLALGVGKLFGWIAL
jgi:hypothetical protein